MPEIFSKQVHCKGETIFLDLKSVGGRKVLCLTKSVKAEDGYFRTRIDIKGEYMPDFMTALFHAYLISDPTGAVSWLAARSAGK